MIFLCGLSPSLLNEFFRQTTGNVFKTSLELVEDARSFFPDNFFTIQLNQQVLPLFYAHLLANVGGDHDTSILSDGYTKFVHIHRFGSLQ